MEPKEYWAECIGITAEDNGFTLTVEQIDCLAEAVQGAHECYGMAFYSPPPSDRFNQIESEWREKYKRLEAEFENYQNNAETAVKKALRQYSDTQVSIGTHGEVFRHGGRTEQIQ